MLTFVRKAWIAYFFLLDNMALTTMPMPNPVIMDPTKYRGDVGRKKNPTPKPMIAPPPIAQVLLSSFLFDIGQSNS
jgi:hypothetical protein